MGLAFSFALMWGTVPDWFAAVGTVGTLAVAVRVIFSDHQRRREDEVEALRERTEAQARLIAGWLVGPDTTRHSPAALETGIRRYYVRVVNRSDLPAYGCLLRLEWPGEPGSHTVHGVLAPGDDHTESIAISDSPAATHSFPVFSLGFVDAGGRAWRKYADGRLEAGSWPPYEMQGGGRQ